MVVVADGRIYTRSAASLRIARAMRAPWPLLGICLLIPRFIRDALYDYIAHHRYRWFGRSATCRMPTESERAWFPD